MNSKYLLFGLDFFIVNSSKLQRNTSFTAIINVYKVIELFCIVDVYYNIFDRMQAKHTF